jgi:hypothetical protein
MTTPSNATYTTLIGAINGTPPVGSGWTVLLNSASASPTQSALYTSNGFSATAFISSIGQIAVAIEGVGRAVVGLS